MRKLIIAGIDPGTTAAYALFDTEGNFLIVRSERNISNHRMISDILRLGKVLVVSCDVRPAPRVVESIAKKIGAVLFVPEKTLFLSKKTRLVDEWLKKQKNFIKISNKHERDAIAAALFAYKQVRKIFDKIENELDAELSDIAKERVLKERIAVRKIVG